MVATFGGKLALTRRDVVRGLTALTAAPLVQPMMMTAAQAQEKPILTARSLNHIHFDSTDVQRAVDFWYLLLGAKVRDKAKGFWVMLLPEDLSGMPHWLAINNTPQPHPNRDGGIDKAGQYTHMGIGVDFPDPQATARESEVINKRFPFAEAKPTGGWTVKNDFPGSRSIYYKDQDGVIVQLLRGSDDAYTADGVIDAEAPPWKAPAEKPLVMARSFNNMHFNVSDLDRTATFYKNLLGTTVHAKSADGSGYSLLFPNSTTGRKTWLGIKKAPATGPYTHMGISIDIDDGANSMENLAVAINKRFTFAKAKAVGKAVGGKKGARAVSMFDPDGMPFELCRHDDDGAV